MRSILVLICVGAAAADNCIDYNKPTTHTSGVVTYVQMECKQLRTGIPECDFPAYQADNANPPAITDGQKYPASDYIGGQFGRDWAAAGARYYGVPAVDQLVFIGLLIMALKITKPWASSNAAGGAKCLRLMEFLMYFVMMWVGKILVFSESQQIGLFLEYLPFVGLYGLVKESAPISFAYALILSYMFIQGTFYDAISALTTNSQPYTTIGFEEVAYPGRTALTQPTVIGDQTTAAGNQCYQNGNLGPKFFGCYCTMVKDPDQYFIQPRYWFNWDRWTGALQIFTIFYTFCAAISIVLHFARVSNTYTRTGSQ